jgi:FHS family Na+ dependent glucose MFS transporter 1
VILLLPGWPPAIWIGTIGLGLSIASMFPSSLNYAERLMPISGLVTSLLLVGANTGSMVLPWVIGQLFESAGPLSMVVLLWGVQVAALALLLVIMLYSRRFENRQENDFSYK